MSFRVNSPRRSRWLGSQDFNIHDRPYTPHPYDDEFDADTLNSSWHVVYSNGIDTVNAIDPTASFSAGGVRLAVNSGQRVARKSWLKGQSDGQFWFAKKAISVAELGPNFCVYSRMGFTIKDVASQTDNDATVGLGLFGANDFNNCVIAQINEGDANEISMEMGKFEGGAFTFIGSESNNVGGAGTVEGQHAHTVAIQVLNNTTVHVWAMSAAGNWLWFGTTTYTSGVHTVGVFGRSIITANNEVQGFDYVRFKRGRFLP